MSVRITEKELRDYIKQFGDTETGKKVEQQLDDQDTTPCVASEERKSPTKTKEKAGIPKKPYLNPPLKTPEFAILPFIGKVIVALAKIILAVVKAFLYVLAFMIKLTFTLLFLGLPVFFGMLFAFISLDKMEPRKRGRY